jgi:hypothetical protein
MFDIFFQIGAWIGFIIFCVCAVFGGVMFYHAVSLSITVVYARWKWKKVKAGMGTPTDAMIMTDLMNKEMEKEDKKDKATTTAFPDTKYKDKTYTTNEQSTGTTVNPAGKIPTPRKV